MQKYKFKNTNAKIPIQKYKWKNANAKIQIQKYKCKNINAKIQKYDYKKVEKEEEDDELACAGCGDAIYFMSGE